MTILCVFDCTNACLRYRHILDIRFYYCMMRKLNVWHRKGDRRCLGDWIYTTVRYHHDERRRTEWEIIRKTVSAIRYEKGPEQIQKLRNKSTTVYIIGSTWAGRTQTSTHCEYFAHFQRTNSRFFWCSWNYTTSTSAATKTYPEHWVARLEPVSHIHPDSSSGAVPDAVERNNPCQ